MQSPTRTLITERPLLWTGDDTERTKVRQTDAAESLQPLFLLLAPLQEEEEKSKNEYYGTGEGEWGGGGGYTPTRTSANRSKLK